MNRCYCNKLSEHLELENSYYSYIYITHIVFASDGLDVGAHFEAESGI